MAAVNLQLAHERLLWPKQALEKLQSPDPPEPLTRVLLLLRLQRLQEAELALIAALQYGHQPRSRVLALDLLCNIRFRQKRYQSCATILDQLDAVCSEHQIQPASLSLWRSLLALVGVQSQHDQIKPDSSWPDVHPLEPLLDFQQLLQSKNAALITERINSWPEQLNSPEALETKALALKNLGRIQEAQHLLSQLLSRTRGSAAVWKAALEINLRQKSNAGLAMAQALRHHPKDPAILALQVANLLEQRQPALARRTALRERLQHSLGRSGANQQQSDANLLASYELTGRADLLTAVHPAINTRLPSSPALHANLVMQLASLGSPLYGPSVEALAATLPERHSIPRRSQRSALRVGLISPDLRYHPVGRFVQMLLSAGFGRQGELHLINTAATAMRHLQHLAGNRFHNLTGQPPQQQLDQIRALNLDVAIDLAGWTGENNGWIFANGLAPLQVNYLGYFASSGLPAMDLWLGDQALFPDPLCEWHNERIVRLPRPFLAWQPDTHLPEGRVAVPPPPSGPITFGSFNNSRKLSAATLSLWGRILRSIPGARLALKAFGSDDPSLVALLQQRMASCGLDPAAVIWLPLCPSPEEHLRQYGLIDVALDPFPNGGCTTSCEALWMGVPVITLCGDHYAGRMSTAVLQGAGLSEWIAHSEAEYLALAQQAAERLSAIRASRNQLRAHLQSSPLGDATDLGDQLWSCLEQLA